MLRSRAEGPHVRDVELLKNDVSGLVIIAIATLFIRYRRMPAAVRPPWPVILMLWVGTAVMLGVVIFGVVNMRG